MLAVWGAKERDLSSVTPRRTGLGLNFTGALSMDRSGLHDASLPYVLKKLTSLLLAFRFSFQLLHHSATMSTAAWISSRALCSLRCIARMETSSANMQFVVEVGSLAAKLFI